MPARSKHQYAFMQTAAHSPTFAKKNGITPEQAREFVAGMSAKDVRNLPNRSTNKRKGK